MYKRTEDDMDKEKIKILIVRPGEEPEEAMIIESASSLQDIVGGYFELVKPPIHTDDTKIICNEEGKLNGSEPNSPILDEFLNCYDILYGTIIICRHPVNSTELASLTDEQVERYKKIYSLTVRGMYVF